ncbi:MAG: SMP-30/gluconolactonase/LRE family protein [Gammaproteobacteria bacterium]|nr:SMP-30/gluconolactonase/LRE family protein [Gammaproteobacteria bacterium]
MAELGGGPNGAAIGPDGWCYVCNNGGFKWIERGDRLFPGEEPESYAGGRIEKVNLDTGAVEVLYTHCAGQPLRGPNDLVFDRDGGFWFTDHGKTRSRERDRTGVFYARADGSEIDEVIFPMDGPNGIGLSPQEDELYVAETTTGRVQGGGAAQAPASCAANSRGRRRTAAGSVAGTPGYLAMFDCLAVDGRRPRLRRHACIDRRHHRPDDAGRLRRRACAAAGRRPTW